MVERAARTIIVADSSKIGRSALAAICPLEEIDELITDTAAPGRAGRRAARRRDRGDPGLMAAPAPRSLAVSTNPAIDRVARLGGPAAGVVKAAEFLETPGGKGAHVAMVAWELGAEVELLTTAGGRSGDLFLALLEDEDFPVHAVRVAGATRGTYTVVVDGEADVVEVHEPAGEFTAADADALVAALAAIAGDFDTVAICGSLPPGAPTDLHARLVTAARDRGSPHDPRLLDRPRLRGRPRRPSPTSSPPTSPRPAR